MTNASVLLFFFLNSSLRSQLSFINVSVKFTIVVLLVCKTTGKFNEAPRLDLLNKNFVKGKTKPHLSCNHSGSIRATEDMALN